MRTTIKDQIIEQVDRLDDIQRRLTAPEGIPGRDLLRFARAIDRVDLE
jgi:hypothetical protein